MMKVSPPFRFRADEILDVEKFNLNNLHLKEELDESMGRRYIRSTMRLPLDGVDRSTNVAARRVALYSWATATVNFQVEAVRVVAWGTDAKTVTIKSDLDNFTEIVGTMLGITATTQAELDAEKLELFSAHQAIIDTAAAKYIYVEVESGGTIANGYLEIDILTDRALLGTTPDHTGFTPNLLDTADDAEANVADAIHTALATAQNNDAANVTDLRCEVFAIRNPVAGTTYTWVVPAGGMTVDTMQVGGYRSAGAGTATWTLDDEAGAPQLSVDWPSNEDDTSPDTMNDDNDDSADDYHLEMVVTAGTTVPMTYCILWYT